MSSRGQRQAEGVRTRGAIRSPESNRLMSSTYQMDLAVSGEGRKRTRHQFLPGGTLRRSSSKKFKMKLTLLTALASPATESFSTAESFSTTKRLPSGCTSKFEAPPRLVNWPGDQSWGLSAWKESPEAV